MSLTLQAVFTVHCCGLIKSSFHNIWLYKFFLEADMTIFVLVFKKWIFFSSLGQISKTHMMTFGTLHTWPTHLGCLHFIFEMVKRKKFVSIVIFFIKRGWSVLPSVLTDNVTDSYYHQFMHVKIVLSILNWGFLHG